MSAPGLKPREVVATVEGYALTGPRTDLPAGWHYELATDGLPTAFIQRWAAHPSTWLRFLRKIGDPEHFWVRGYKTRREAVAG